MGSSSSDSGNSGHSSASSPGLSTGLVSGINIDAVWLASVLGDLVVDGGHDVGPYGGAEHGGQTHGGPGAGVLVIIDTDQRTSRCERHFLQEKNMSLRISGIVENTLQYFKVGTLQNHVVSDY